MQSSSSLHSIILTLSENRLLQDARQAKRLPNWIATILLGVVFLIGAGLLGTAPIIALFLINGSTQSPTDPIGSAIYTSTLNVFSFGPIFLLIWLWVRLYEKRPFKTTGLRLDRAPMRYLRGFLLGILMFALSMAVLGLFGALRPSASTGANPGLVITLPAILLFLVGWLVQGPGEEILCRGWMMPVLGARYTPLAGILISSAIFAAYHSLNPSFSLLAVLNIFLVGIFLCLFCLADDALWGVFGWHTAWNWVQGNVFGLAVSGLNVSSASLFHYGTRGPDFLTGGGFGPEGGLAVTLVLVIGILGALAWHRQRSSGKGAENPV
jgi:uncharacterized protein